MPSYHWLDAARHAIAARDTAVLVSILRHPPLLPVPVGPVAVVSASGVHGSLHLGSAREAVLEACRAQFDGAPGGVPQTLGVTLNPWAGSAADHTVTLQLRCLSPDDAAALDGLHHALLGGHGATLDLEGQALAVQRDDNRDSLPLSVQASGMQAHMARFEAPARTALIVGAGVLAHRVVECLADTPLRVAWLALAAPASLAAWPANAVPLDGAFVLGESCMPACCHVLVMTHDHNLDIDLCHRVLQQGEVQTLGMVGSARKRSLLQAALRERGVDQARIESVRCPIGGGNHDNLEHASVAIAAELLAQR